MEGASILGERKLKPKFKKDSNSINKKFYLNTKFLRIIQSLKFTQRERERVNQKFIYTNSTNFFIRL